MYWFERYVLIGELSLTKAALTNGSVIFMHRYLSGGICRLGYLVETNEYHPCLAMPVMHD